MKALVMKNRIDMDLPPETWEEVFVLFDKEVVVDTFPSGMLLMFNDGSILIRPNGHDSIAHGTIDAAVEWMRTADFRAMPLLMDIMEQARREVGATLENLKRAEAMFQEMGMDYWLAKTREILEKL